jgi:Spy/CpxP family protein refolding chaperone
MTRVRMALAGAVAAAALAVSAAPAVAAPPPCEPGAPGCKTVDDPSKNNPKFTETQRGNVDAPGTESTCVGANNGQTKQVCG